ncbi:hypothetical protein CFIMG_007391RA00001 [Ceratocystis fimbriata CBS 114723]|uniref:Uncharacterized protein n=1 Tax=Ceratocystis fimbriata CBS 114723 TaxID=1035309 RepID=A0A2C5WXT3_9PEZI|nr:hypothetical protein CFIMG_007391RA00001 [Ceratocystis fimbriata CBS 114723]
MAERDSFHASRSRPTQSTRSTHIPSKPTDLATLIELGMLHGSSTNRMRNGLFGNAMALSYYHFSDMFTICSNFMLSCYGPKAKR